MNTKELNEILSNFDLEKKDYSLAPINVGYINDTYLVLDGELRCFILQRINHTVFTDIPGLMSNIENALIHLQDSDYSRIDLVKTNLGKSYLGDLERGYWRLMSYLDHSTSFNTANKSNIAFEAGRIIGNFHELMQNASSDEFVTTIPQFHNLQHRREQYEKAYRSADKERLAKAEQTHTFINKTLPSLEGLLQKKLPIRICHNDTKLNNILFSTKNNKALCLIDLDTIMKGYFYYDFGDAVRTIVNRAPEDERDLKNITFDTTLFESFLEGLRESFPSLTPIEIESLPLGVIYMPFIHGLRALTDYLNNDLYYKVSYRDQNLDRSLSLFHFANLAIKKLPYIIKTIDEKFSSG